MNLSDSMPGATRCAMRESRAVAAYLGLALGDALGATVEFMNPAEIRATHGVHKKIVGGGWLRLKAGQVTDDTTMALALGEAIMGAGGRVYAQAVAQAFDAWMRAKPVDIGHTVRRGLLHFRLTGQTQVPLDEHAAGNGAVMRVLPAILATLNADEDALRHACLTQAHITHHNPLSDAAMLCVARMVRRAINGEDLPSLYAGEVVPFLQAHPVFVARKREENPSGYVVDTLRAVFQALFDNHDFETTLVDVVNRGGDADTTGAIAGMIAGAVYGETALPARWLRALDPVVRERCTAQARALSAIHAV
ncbi:MAG: ADP-ribosyl-[dinitrogen reductase] hydrolase [Halothiobacillaceae bacterium]|nr:ADP-ribosyl-[dinitrogen reductase] hydrolase [Halothiobacillaceae bacterium]